MPPMRSSSPISACTRRSPAAARSARRQVRDVLVRALEERGRGALDPLRDAGELSSKLARRLALSSERDRRGGPAAELRDIGMVSIPDTVLRKPGALNEEEWALIRQHPIVGETILHAAPALGPIAGLVRSTHERYDGRGYPDRLRGEQIPLGARIIAICDAFVAIVSARTYREARTKEDALAELRRCAGTQFDPALVSSSARSSAPRAPRSIAVPPSRAVRTTRRR